VSLEILVVDNASGDGSADMVASEFPEVRILANSENLGFARANNQAIPLGGGEYVLLLNPDTVIRDPRLLATWVEFMDRNPDAGASGCRLLEQDGRHQVGDAGYRPSLRSLFGHFWFLSSLAPGVFAPLFLRDRRLVEPIDVDWVCGAAFLVRGSILDRVGLLHSDAFMYGEDVEWGCRIRAAGYRVVHLPQIAITHLQGRSTQKQEESAFSTLWLVNLRALYFHYNPRQLRFIYDFVLATGLCVRILLYGIAALRRSNTFARRRVRMLSKYLQFTVARFGRRGPAWHRLTEE